MIAPISIILIHELCHHGATTTTQPCNIAYGWRTAGAGRRYWSEASESPVSPETSRRKSQNQHLARDILRRIRNTASRPRHPAESHNTSTSPETSGKECMTDRACDESVANFTFDDICVTRVARKTAARHKRDPWRCGGRAPQLEYREVKFEHRGR